MKITPADKWFSLCIRERVDWNCEHCGSNYRQRPQGLHCSHLFSRRHYATRHDPNNAFAHCYGCHQRLGGCPVTFTRWAEQHLGIGLVELVREKHLDTGLGKMCKKKQKEIAAHYKSELSRLQKQRAEGITGRLEVTAWA